MPAIDRRLLANRFADADADGASNAQKGKALEDIVAHVFEAVPGIEARFRNVLDVFESEELDVVFRNRRDPAGFPDLGPELMVECKNWSRRVGSLEVAWFIAKLSHAAQTFGVLVAAHGITGDPAYRSAALQQLMLARAQGIVVVVLTRAEIESLATGEELAELIMDKRLALVTRGALYERTPVEAPERRLSRGSISIGDAVDGFWEAQVREMRVRMPPAMPDTRAVANELERQSERVDEARRHDDDADPLYRSTREQLLSLGAVALRTLDFGLWDRWSDEWVSGSAQMAGPGGIQPRVGTEIWDLLLRYLIKQIRDGSEIDKTQATFVIVAMVVVQLMVIDDIDPE